MKPHQKVKNPCKYCFQSVNYKNGLQCMGACKKWAHYKCLSYTPGKIADIKAGAITVTCPCPDCNTTQPKEFVTNPPFSCSNSTCPANVLPKCDSRDCPVNRRSVVSFPCPPPGTKQPCKPPPANPERPVCPTSPCSLATPPSPPSPPSCPPSPPPPSCPPSPPPCTPSPPSPPPCPSTPPSPPSPPPCPPNPPPCYPNPVPSYPCPPSCYPSPPPCPPTPPPCPPNPPPCPPTPPRCPATPPPASILPKLPQLPQLPLKTTRCPNSPAPCSDTPPCCPPRCPSRCPPRRSPPSPRCCSPRPPCCPYHNKPCSISPPPPPPCPPQPRRPPPPRSPCPPPRSPPCPPPRSPPCHPPRSPPCPPSPPRKPTCPPPPPPCVATHHSSSHYYPSNTDIRQRNYSPQRDLQSLRADFGSPMMKSPSCSVLSYDVPDVAPNTNNTASSVILMIAESNNSMNETIQESYDLPNDLPIEGAEQLTSAAQMNEEWNEMDYAQEPLATDYQSKRHPYISTSATKMQQQPPESDDPLDPEKALIYELQEMCTAVNELNSQVKSFVRKIA